MRQIFIGDVHGMLDELNALLAKLNLREDDTIIFVGDLLDKGPDSVGVVRRVRSLSTTHKVILVMGNHEDTHSRYRKHLKGDVKIAEQMAAKKSELKIITPQLSHQDINFLDSAVYFYRSSTCDILVVHGGIPASKRTIPHTMEELAAMNSKKRKSLKQILRTRHVHAKTGHFVSLGEEKPGDPFWAEVYDGRFGHVIFGHQPFMDGVRYFKYATGIDTGAVFGGTLTALIVDKDCSQTVVSVESRAYKEPHDFMRE